MDRTKTTSPQSSIDHDESIVDQTNKVVGRFYECNFCKGRFTNAQALGGHMNIHRKEKAIKASRAKAAAKDQKQQQQQQHHHHHENFGSSFSSCIAHDQVNSMGSNLSLTIGKLYHEDNIDQGIEWNQINGNELDLELRLGYK